MTLQSERYSSGKNSKFQFIARAGYLAKGVVYGTVGLLTLGALYGWFGSAQITGTRGALKEIASQPFGTLLLVAMILGLAGYVALRLVQAFKDIENKGSDASGLAQRAGFLISGLVYAGLALYAAQLAGWLGGGSGGGSGSSRQELTAQLMAQQWGIWLIGLVGVVLIGVGLYQGYRAVTRKFEQNWTKSGAAKTYNDATVRFAQFGVAARGFTLILVGGIVVQAAMQANPEQARGLGHALQSLRDETYGTILLTLVGAGLMCYGLYCFINARHRKI